MRILSFICMVLGIVLFFSPITTILGYIPLVGGIISGIVGFAIFLAAVLISIPLYLLIISIAWLVFHPKVGVALILIAGVITALVLILGARHGNDSDTTAQTQAHMGFMLRSAFS